jgi:deoxycytidylate deaminase
MAFTEQQALEKAVLVAAMSPCAKSKRGVVIFHRRQGIVATGFNHPPHPFKCDGSEECRTNCNKVCVHAETAALHDLRLQLVRLHPNTLEMLHVKAVDGTAVASGPPSCWQCSREILEARISAFWLLHAEGLRRYTAEEFHTLTMQQCGLPVIR